MFTIRKATRDPAFYADLCPFLLSKAVHGELGEDPVFDDDRFTWFIAKVGDEVVGWSACFMKSVGAGVLAWSYVVPGHRRKGLWRQLLQLRLDSLREQGAKTVTACTKNPALKGVLGSSFVKTNDRGSWTFYSKSM